MARKLIWERRSKRLWVAEHGGRRFRIERSVSTHPAGGSVLLREVDRLERDVRKQPEDSYVKAASTAESWLA